METPQTPAPSDDPKHVALIPDDQNELAALALRVVKAWPSFPQLVLLWITVAEATTQANDFAAAVKTRDDLEKARDPLTVQKRTLEAKMNQNLKHVKAYVNEEWENDAEAESHYGTFGIEETSAGWRLPADQQERVKALKDMLQALDDHGMAGRKFGKAFWQELLTAYEPLVTKGENTTQALSGAVGIKNPQQEAVGLFLSRFNSLLVAQSRTTKEYLALRRQLGYLKEYNK